MNKVLLLGAGFTTRNMGVWALASGAATAVWRAHPDAQVNFLDYNATPASYPVRGSEGVREIRLINLRFSKRFWLPNNIARLLFTVLLINMIPSRALRDRLYSRNRWLTHVREADMAGSIAGGDSFSDIYGFGRLIYVALPQILVLLIGKPLILLPQTIGPFSSSFGKKLARYIMSRATRVYTRDQQPISGTPEFPAESGKGAMFCYDMGFALEGGIAEERIPRWMSRRAPGTPLLGINVSGLLHIGGYTGTNMFGLKGDYRNIIHSLINHFVQRHNAQIMLVPHVLGGRETEESDVAACDSIFRDASPAVQKRLHLLEDGYDHHELKALIGRCDFFLGSRMHACIAALSQGIPAVGLAYSPKFQGVFGSAGVKELVVDLQVHDEPAVVEIAEALYQRSKEFSARLHEKLPQIQSAISSLFVNI